MKKTLFAISAIAVLLGFTACTSENETLEPQVSGKTILKAYTEEATRTALSGDDETGYKVVWSFGDHITVGGKIFALKAEGGGVGTTSGTFEGDELTDGEYTAYYPADYDGTNWPTAQTYVENNIPDGSPMKATFTYTTGEEPSLKFQNEGGILRLNLKGEAKVKSIKISATGLAPITLDCLGMGIELNTTTATPFHIAVPGTDEGTDYSGLKIVIIDNTGGVCTKTLKSDKSITVKRSKITTVNLSATKFCNYLCFTAEEDDASVGMNVYGTSWTLPTLEYSTDLFTWETFTLGTTDVPLTKAGDKVYFRATEKLSSFSTATARYVNFTMKEKKVAASGNVMSLVDPTCESTTLPSNYCFYKLFYRCESLTTAPELPAKKLNSNCYYQMFYGCKNLNSVTCLATINSAQKCVEGWLDDTAAHGTFYCAPGRKDIWEGKVNGWTIEEMLY